MKKLNSQGFTMIELLVVLLIIGILAAVAAPFFLGNSNKAKISEAVAGAGSIRSAERNYNAEYSAYLTVPNSETLYFGTGGTDSSYLGVTIHGNRYFSPNAYSVALGAAWDAPATVYTAAAVDFIITVNGSDSETLATDATDGAANAGDVTNFIVQMDNSGQIYYSTTGVGGTWYKW